MIEMNDVITYAFIFAVITTLPSVIVIIVLSIWVKYFRKTSTDLVYEKRDQAESEFLDNLGLLEDYERVKAQFKRYGESYIKNNYNLVERQKYKVVLNESANAGYHPVYGNILQAKNIDLCIENIKTGSSLTLKKVKLENPKHDEQLKDYLDCVNKYPNAYDEEAERDQKMIDYYNSLPPEKGLFGL